MRWTVSCLLAIGFAALALLVQLGMEQRMVVHSVFSFFYLAILASALLRGTIAGAVAAIAGGILCAVFVLPPQGQLRFEEVEVWTEMALFAIVATAIVLVVDRLRRERDRSERLGRELARQRDTLEDTVRQRTAELEGSYERMRVNERMAAVGNLAAGVAHDLGNLIMPMRLRLRSLTERQLPAAAQDDVNVLSLSVDYLRSLAHGLRLFARDPAHAEPDEVTHPQEWLADTLPFFRNILPPAIELKVDVPEDLPDVAVAPHRLTQAVINLIGNARNAIGEGSMSKGLVEIHAARQNGRVRLEVVDNGPGMTEEVRARCLEPYFTTRGQQGTGLGLALVREIAHSAGGEVEVESSPGQGARVALTLPAVEVEEA